MSLDPKNSPERRENDPNPPNSAGPDSAAHESEAAQALYDQAFHSEFSPMAIQSIDLAEEMTINELGIDRDGVIRDDFQDEITAALRSRFPKRIAENAQLSVASDGRLVACFEIWRPNGRLLPATHLFSEPDSSDGRSSAKPSDGPQKKKTIVGVGSGSAENDDWRVVPGQGRFYLTQRFAGSSGNGFTLAVRSSSFEAVEAMFNDISDIDGPGKNHSGRYLLDCAVAQGLSKSLGIEVWPENFEYRAISTLRSVAGGAGALDVEVKLQLPHLGEEGVYRGDQMLVGLSPGKLVTVLPPRNGWVEVSE